MSDFKDFLAAMAIEDALEENNDSSPQYSYRNDSSGSNNNITSGCLMACVWITFAIFIGILLESWLWLLGIAAMGSFLGFYHDVNIELKKEEDNKIMIDTHSEDESPMESPNINMLDESENSMTTETFDEEYLTISDKEANKMDKYEELKELESEVKILHEILDSLNKEAESIKARLSNVEIQLSKKKVVASSCQTAVPHEEVILNITEAPKSERTDTDELQYPREPIIPITHEIEGLKNISNTIWENLKSFFRANDNYDDKIPLKLVNLAYSITQIGKEIIFIKHDSVLNDTELKEAKSIFETCVKIYDIKESNDTLGFQKYINFLYGKYPVPNNPFRGTKPVDFFCSVTDSVFINAHFFYYFLCSWAKELNETLESITFGEPIEKPTNKCTINKFFVHSCLYFTYELAKMGYTIAIIPILDKDIFYRPQRMAQMNDCYSMLYFNKYVDIPEMVDDETYTNTPYYSFSGSTFVSGHYRQGHWRNGKWVSGGYVRGHYRS